MGFRDFPITWATALCDYMLLCALRKLFNQALLSHANSFLLYIYDIDRDNVNKEKQNSRYLLQICAFLNIMILFPMYQKYYNYDRLHGSQQLIPSLEIFCM